MSSDVKERKDKPIQERYIRTAILDAKRLNALQEAWKQGNDQPLSCRYREIAQDSYECTFIFNTEFFTASTESLLSELIEDAIKGTPSKNIKDMYRYTVFLEDEQFQEIQAKNPQSFTIEPNHKFGTNAYTLYSSACDASVMAELSKENLVSYSTRLELLLQLSADKQRALTIHLLKLDPKDAADILIARDPLIFHQWLSYLNKATENQLQNMRNFWNILYAIAVKLGPIQDYDLYAAPALIKKCTAKHLNVEEGGVQDNLDKIKQGEESYRKESETALEQTLKFYALSLVNLEPKKAVDDLFQHERDIRDRSINHLQQLKAQYPDSIGKQIEKIQSLSVQKFTEIYAPSKPLAQRSEKPDQQPVELKQRISYSPDTSDRKVPLKDKKNMYSYMVFLEDAQFKEIQSKNNLPFKIEPFTKLAKNAYTLYSFARDARVAAEVGKNLPLSPKLTTALLSQLTPDKQRALVIPQLFLLKPKEAAEILIARDPLICFQWLHQLNDTCRKEDRFHYFNSIINYAMVELEVSVHTIDYTIISKLIAAKLKTDVEQVYQRLGELQRSEQSHLKESEAVLQQARELSLTGPVPTLLKLDPVQAAKTLYEYKPHVRLRFINDLTQLAKRDHTSKEKIDSIFKEFYETLINQNEFLRPDPEQKRKYSPPDPAPVNEISTPTSIAIHHHLNTEGPLVPTTTPNSDIKIKITEADQPQLLDSEFDVGDSKVDSSMTKENLGTDEKKKNQSFHVSTRSKDMYPYRYTVFLEKTQFLELQAKESLPYIIEPCPQFGEKAYTLYSNLSDASIVGELGSDPLISRFPKLAKELLLQLIPDKQKELAAHLLKLNPNEAAEILVARDPLIFYEWLSHLAEITKNKNTGKFSSILLAIGSKLNCNFRINTHDPQAMIEVFTARKLDIERAAVKNNLDAIRQGQTLRRKGSEDILDLTLRFYLGSLLRLDPKVAAEDVLQQEPEIRERFKAYLQERNDDHKGKGAVLQKITEISLARRRFDSQPHPSDSKNRNYPNSQGIFPSPRPTIYNDTAITIRPLPPPPPRSEPLSSEAKICIGVAIFTVLGSATGYASYKLIEKSGKAEAANQFFSNNYQSLLMLAGIAVLLGLILYCRIRCRYSEDDRVTVVPR